MITDKEKTVPLLSACLAVYNVGEFLPACLDSLVSQTYSGFELICQDDGSTDNSLDILKSYAAKDTRIRIIANPENRGLAVIRNQALKEAKGKYILLLDGDDLYASTYFEKAVALAEKKGSDMVMSDHLVFYNEEEIPEKQKETSPLEHIDTKDKLMLLRRGAFAWTKLMRTEKVRELGIHYPEGLTRQDIPAHWKLVLSLDKISLLPERMIFYRQQPDATTHKKDEKLFSLALVMDIVKADLQKEPVLWEKWKKEFYRQQLDHLQGMQDRILPELKPKAMEMIRERITPEHYEFLDAGLEVRQNTRWFFQKLRGDRWAAFKLWVWESARSLYRKVR